MGIPAPAKEDFTTLQDLADGEAITSGNGSLVFDDFLIVASGSIPQSLSSYKVVQLVDGFAIAGPIHAAGGGAGDLLIQYTVSSSSPITLATLLFNGKALGDGASASVVETYDEPVDVELFVFSTGDGGVQRTDSLDLEGFTQLRVTKDILVASGGPGGLAVISWIEQRFENVPEPAMLLLLGGSALLVIARRRAAH